MSSWNSKLPGSSIRSIPFTSVLMIKGSHLPPTLSTSHIPRNKITYGKIKGSNPKRLHPLKVNKLTSLSLATGDIAGAQTNTLPERFLKSKTRKDFREVTKTKDIPGALPSSLRRGITTKRATNPLDPKYKLLDTPP